MNITELLTKAVDEGASDFFAAAGKRIYHRRNGEVIPFSEEVLSADEIDRFRKKVLLPEAESIFRREGDFDAGITLADGVRFRINFLLEQGKPGFVARPVPSSANLSFEKLNLPGSIRKLAEYPRGLVLISGAAGSGKSTTMAAMVNHINSRWHRHIITVEDPVEFIHPDRKSLITQREVGADTESFAKALRNVVRESPDVIVIGEMRDPETMQTAVSAALTGHLVISTVHTADTIQTVERIINYYPEHLRKQAAGDLALALNGITSQRLVVSKNNDDGLIPVNEILIATPYVKKLIASGRFAELENALRGGREEGMITFTRALSTLFHDEKVTLETGLAAASNREEFMLLSQGMESGIETFASEIPGAELPENKVTMKNLLYSAIKNNASDILLTAGCRPVLRINGELNKLQSDVLKPADTQKLLFSVINRRQRTVFEEERELDFALTLNLGEIEKSKNTKPRRFRLNGFFQRGNTAIAVRVINQNIPSAKELGIPDAVLELADLKQGLILVTGPTGHGKSTTLASLIDRINHSRYSHIITVEDPIEYVHENINSVIEQREVHSDTVSFANALKYVLRQDPDVILVGEMRDTETISAALTAAETGHLVMATLHTNNAPQTIDRIVDSFPQHQQNQIRLQLAGCLAAVIAQRLLPRIDGSGRVAAFEILKAHSGVSALIRDGKTHQIQSLIETNAKGGMVTMEKALLNLYEQGLIDRESSKSFF